MTGTSEESDNDSDSSCENSASSDEASADSEKGWFSSLMESRIARGLVASAVLTAGLYFWPVLVGVVRSWRPEKPVKPLPPECNFIVSAADKGNYEKCAVKKTCSWLTSNTTPAITQLNVHGELENAEAQCKAVKAG